MTAALNPSLSDVAGDLRQLLERSGGESTVRTIRRTLRVLRLTRVPVEVVATRNCRLVQADEIHGIAPERRYRVCYHPLAVKSLEAPVLVGVVAIEAARIWQLHHGLQATASRESARQRYRVAGAAVRRLYPLASLTKRVAGEIAHLSKSEVPPVQRVTALKDGWRWHRFVTNRL